MFLYAAFKSYANCSFDDLELRSITIYLDFLLNTLEAPKTFSLSRWKEDFTSISSGDFFCIGLILMLDLLRFLEIWSSVVEGWDPILVI